MLHNKILYWFTNDLRLHDNPLINQLAIKDTQASFIYIIDEPQAQHAHYLMPPMSEQKQQFLLATLNELNVHLNHLGQTLQVLQGHTYQILFDYITQNQISELVVAQQTGWYERQLLEKLQSELPKLKLTQAWQHTLFAENYFNDNAKLLKSFTAFRKDIEAHLLGLIGLPLDKPTQLPMPFQNLTLPSEPVLLSFNSVKGTPFLAGESAAQTHLLDYFSSRSPSSYKQTRNELDGWENSTKFSPYLALGSLSARQIWDGVNNYERAYGDNESTYWIKFELLWREYFQWWALKRGNGLFLFKGLKPSKPLTSFFPERFKKWCTGNTPYPLVNACMKELNATGFMSNRGRQIVASCLVNELGIDWRYGAAYFQQQLLDHDVASNWGNWQYIAGVGADPKGGRHFDIAFQTSRYDPQHAFINKWNGEQCDTQLDSANMVDWPT